MTAPLQTPDAILAAAGLSVLPGAGYLTLQIELSRNLLGGEPILRLSTIDPAASRRKPVNLLRAAGVADVIIGSKEQGAPELLEMVAKALRMAATA